MATHPEWRLAPGELEAAEQARRSGAQTVAGETGAAAKPVQDGIRIANDHLKVLMGDGNGGQLEEPVQAERLRKIVCGTGLRDVLGRIPVVGKLFG